MRLIVKLIAVAWLIFASCELALARSVELEAKHFEKISFGKIPETKYSFENGELHAKAHSSASALIKAFDKVQKTREVQFQWQSSGELAVRDARHEASKRGDDARLRVGLIIHGRAPTVPFFAPAWIKATRDALKLPSDRMIYLVASAQHSPGSTWNSPYSSSIKNIAVASEASSDDSWQQVHHKFEKAQNLAGLWIMVDSDDTNSEIETRLRALKLK